MSGWTTFRPAVNTSLVRSFRTRSRQIEFACGQFNKQLVVGLCPNRKLSGSDSKRLVHAIISEWQTIVQNLIHISFTIRFWSAISTSMITRLNDDPEPRMTRAQPQQCIVGPLPKGVARHLLLIQRFSLRTAREGDTVGRYSSQPAARVLLRMT